MIHRNRLGRNYLVCFFFLFTYYCERIREKKKSKHSLRKGAFLSNLNDSVDFLLYGISFPFGRGAACSSAKDPLASRNNEA